MLFHIIALLSGRDAGEGGKGGGEDITTTTFRKQPVIYPYFTHGGESPGNNPIQKPSLKSCPFLLFSVSSFIRRKEIALCLWLTSIGDTTKFQFAFRSKITLTYIFEPTNCRRKILMHSLLEKRQ